MSNAYATRPSLKLKMIFGTGAIATASWSALAGLALFFYNQVIGVPAYLVSLALSVSIFIDTLWDPVIGQCSDKCRSRWGRRHPFMYAAILLAPIALALRYHPPTALSDAQMFTYILLTGLFLNFATSLFEVPSGALAPELAPEYHDRTVLMSFRFAFQALGGVATSVLIYGVFLRSTAEHKVGQLNPDGYGPLSLTIAALSVVVMLIFAIGTHDRIPGLHRPAEVTPDWREQVRDIIATLKNWNFGVAVVANSISGLMGGLTSGLMLYFNTYFWELSSQQILMMLLMAAPAAPLAAFVAPRIGRRWGKKRSAMTAMMAAITVHVAPIVLRLVGAFPDNDTPLLLPLLMAIFLVNATLGICGFILISSMVSDIVEDSQVNTGMRSEGLILTADSLPQRLITSFATLAPGLLLAAIGFPERSQPGEVPPETLDRLGLFYAPIVFAIAGLSVATWSFFRIDETTHNRNLDTLRGQRRGAD